MLSGFVFQSSMKAGESWYLDLRCVPGTVPSAACVLGHTTLPRILGGPCNPHFTDEEPAPRSGCNLHSGTVSARCLVQRPELCGNQEV